MRKATSKRETLETAVLLTLNIDGTGICTIQTGFGFFDHFLTLLAFWAKWDLELEAKGDTHIDAHHLVEDVGLVLGTALAEALGDKKGIERAAFARVPMDEALTEVTVDFSGRPWLEWRGGELLPPTLAGEESDLWREFCKALASGVKSNIHIHFLYGKNGHHLLESAAKGLGRAFAAAAIQSGNCVPSTKGKLDS